MICGVHGSSSDRSEPLTLQYLTLLADYIAVSISELSEGPVDMDDLGLPDDLQRDIECWQDEYEPLLPRGTDEPERARFAGLDATGLELADRIADAVGDGTKVRYFSGGTGDMFLPERTGSWPSR
jgi:hypothetical protein